jgi:hypothetical protein
VAVSPAVRPSLAANHEVRRSGEEDAMPER